MKKFLVLNFSFFILVFISCYKKTENKYNSSNSNTHGQAIQYSDTFKTKDNLEINAIDSNDKNEENNNHPCQENRACLMWNIDQVKYIPRHHVINARQSKNNFVNNEFSSICSSSTIQSKNYKLEITQVFDSSSIKTGEFDGKIYCINQSFLESGICVRVNYKRSEGGHTSDEIIIFTLDKDSTEQSYLPIVSEFGKDGYNKKIEGEIINKQLYKRIISEH